MTLDQVSPLLGLTGGKADLLVFELHRLQGEGRTLQSKRNLC
jgi:hypothetical protein